MIENKICVLIVDDEMKMVKALTDFLTASGYATLQAFDGQNALDVYYDNNSEIDLIILDAMMPKLDGFQVLAELRSGGEIVPVIMLTARSEEYDQLKGFKSGADDYVTKPFSPSLLLARVENLMGRMGKGEVTEITAGGISISVSKRTVHIDGENCDLRRREFDLLHFLMINKSLIFTREQLLDKVWGYAFEGDIRTVDTHIKQLRLKLGDKGTLIKTIHRIGYRFEEINENNH